MWKVKVVVVVSMAVMLLLPPLADCVEKEPDNLAILSAMCSTSSGTESQPQQKKELTVELIHGSQELRGREVNGIQWAPDKERFTYYQPESETKRPCIWTYDLKTGKREIFIDSKKIKVLEEPKIEKRITLSNYFWSPTGRDILLPSGNDLYLYHIASGRVTRLTNDEEIERSPQFSPDGKKIAFIKNHNIQVLDIESGDVTPLTIEGREHLLIGQFDWVYEEEFDIHSGFFWAPDSQHIAYFQLDEKKVPESPIIDFIPIHNQIHPLRYPKAGDKNSIVQIGVVSVAHRSTVWMDLGKEINIYIPRIKWLPHSENLAIYRLNRDQNKLELLLGDIHTGKTRMILVEEEKHGWIDINDDLTFLKDGTHFVWSSDRDGFKHLYLYDIQGKLIRQLTKILPGQGNWQVDDLVAVDEENKTVYFRATERDLRERHLYRVNLSGKGFKRLSPRERWHQINMAPDCKYYLDFFSNLTTPTKVSLHTSDGKMVDMIEPNEIEALNECRLSTPEFLSFESEDGVELNAFMIKPANFDPEKKYPVLIYTYGGPGSQIVVNAWDEDPRQRYLWHQMMTQKGYIIFGVDNRGTGGRGRDWMEVVYRRLGELEVKDQIAGVKYLRTLPYVDGERIGIWGWSYGGYTTCMCLLKGAGYFKLGIAVAPVTDWKNYDTVYTERYMDTPQDNPEGYKESSTATHAKNLKRKLLLVHGTSDDNVHLANTMQLAYALQNARKPFDLMIYPRKMHHIGGQDTRVHLFNLITDYIVRNL